VLCGGPGAQPYLVEYFLYDSRRLASIAVEKGVVDEDSGLTQLTQLPGNPPAFEKRRRYMRILCAHRCWLNFKGGFVL